MEHCALVRFWKGVDIQQICKHLILAGELTGSCENCQHLGIDFANAVFCPQCQTPFRYAGFRPRTNKAEERAAISRLREKRPDLEIVDYEDIKRACGKSQARNLFDR